MSVSTNRVIRLSFTTVGGKTYSLSLPNPKASLSKAEAEAAMDVVLSKNIFITTGGELVGKKDIKIIDTSTDDLYDPPQA